MKSLLLLNIFLDIIRKSSGVGQAGGVGPPKWTENQAEQKQMINVDFICKLWRHVQSLVVFPSRSSALCVIKSTPPPLPEFCRISFNANVLQVSYHCPMIFIVLLQIVLKLVRCIFIRYLSTGSARSSTICAHSASRSSSTSLKSCSSIWVSSLRAFSWSSQTWISHGIHVEFYEYSYEIHA